MFFRAVRAVASGPEVVDLVLLEQDQPPRHLPDVSDGPVAFLGVWKLGTMDRAGTSELVIAIRLNQTRLCRL